MENENERSIIAAALDEALRDQVKRLFAVLAMLMVDDGGSNVARDKAENASPPDRWCPIARAATPSVRSDRRDLTRRGKWGSTRLDCRRLASRAIDGEIRPSRKADRVGER